MACFVCTMCRPGFKAVPARRFCNIDKVSREFAYTLYISPHQHSHCNVRRGKGFGNSVN